MGHWMRSLFFLPRRFALWFRIAWNWDVKIYTVPRAWEQVSERANEWTSAVERASERGSAEQIEWVSSASKRLSGQASGQILMSRFQEVLNHSGFVKLMRTWPVFIYTFVHVYVCATPCDHLLVMIMYKKVIAFFLLRHFRLLFFNRLPWTTVLASWIAFPASKWVQVHASKASSAEQANGWAVRANERVDEWMAHVDFIYVDSFDSYWVGLWFREWRQAH